MEIERKVFEIRNGKKSKLTKGAKMLRIFNIAHIRIYFPVLYSHSSPTSSAFDFHVRDESKLINLTFDLIDYLIEISS